MSWSWVYIEYCIHRVQYPPSTASTQDCLSSRHSHDYKLIPEWSFSFQPASFWELEDEITFSHSDYCQLTNRWKECQHPACHPSTATQFSSTCAPLQPACTSPNSLDYGIQTRSIMASKCISKFARSRPPPSASPHSLDHRRGVNRWAYSIIIFKRTSNYSPVPPAPSPDILYVDG
jgi:hypothetical protein